jgi:hypothetical protein
MVGVVYCMFICTGIYEATGSFYSEEKPSRGGKTAGKLHRAKRIHRRQQTNARVFRSHMVLSQVHGLLSVINFREAQPQYLCLILCSISFLQAVCMYAL